MNAGKTAAACAIVAASATRRERHAFKAPASSLRRDILAMEDRARAAP